MFYYLGGNSFSNKNKFVIHKTHFLIISAIAKREGNQPIMLFDVSIKTCLLLSKNHQTYHEQDRLLVVLRRRKSTHIVAVRDVIFFF